MSLSQLHSAPNHLRLSTLAHALTIYSQAQTFISFCIHYGLSFLCPQIATLTYYITILTQWFMLDHLVNNYV